MPEVTTLSDLPTEQQVQHTAVLKVALHNLLTVKDQVETLDNVLYDEILDCIDGAEETLQQKIKTLEKAQTNG